MGFRNPITTVTDVDTRITPAGAGVRIYEDNSDAAHPKGVLEYSSGFGTDLPARVLQHATANQRAENASDTGGLMLQGGSYNASVAPNLDLTSVNNGDGTYSGQAILTGGALVVDHAAQWDTGWTDFPLGSPFGPWDTGFSKPQLRRDAAGNVYTRGILKITGALTLAHRAAANVTTVPGQFAPAVEPAQRPIVVLDQAAAPLGLGLLAVSTTGILTVTNLSGVTMPSGYGFLLGVSYSLFP